MAEMRSAINTHDAQIEGNEFHAATAQGSEDEPAAQHNTDMGIVKDTQRRRHGRPDTSKSRRRQPPARDAADLARDSLIESIMKESTLPLYSHPSTGPNLSAVVEDNEDEAAEAFKTQFLQDMEEQRRKKPPKPPPFSKVAVAKGTERTNHGPKLGGSRQQRERHKAAQAQAEAAGTGKK
jgi:hypothetical protein